VICNAARAFMDGNGGCLFFWGGSCRIQGIGEAIRDGIVLPLAERTACRVPAGKRPAAPAYDFCCGAACFATQSPQGVTQAGSDCREPYIMYNARHTEQ